jgi:hypothetical protein
MGFLRNARLAGHALDHAGTALFELAHFFRVVGEPADAWGSLSKTTRFAAAPWLSCCLILYLGGGGGGLGKRSPNRPNCT